MDAFSAKNSVLPEEDLQPCDSLVLLVFLSMHQIIAYPRVNLLQSALILFFSLCVFFP
ncbi:hypothetical protein FTV88_2342 [Heliorestis convoluta]|uniref:Uncharacterized protein n=1 Tax=Heliorestis convoluta TaxID=356322 RepID=A0A5Q2N868_9FIRM|nr:hypothetical protein FTV88_2342 [Heliorestis convoluta]